MSFAMYLEHVSEYRYYSTDHANVFFVWHEITYNMKLFVYNIIMVTIFKFIKLKSEYIIS